MQKMSYRKAIMVICGLGISVFSMAQDFTFSQYSQIRQASNPGRIGSFNEDVRATLGYRKQWYATGSPYNVFSLSAELNVFKNPLKLDKMGFMIGAVQDQMGNGAFKTNYFSFGFSGYKALDAIKRHQISFGILGAMQQRELNPGAFTYNNQFNENGRFFDPSLASGESFGSKNQTHIQFSAGFGYSFQVNEDLQIQANGALLGINSLQESFSTLPDIEKANQKKRFSFGTEVSFRFSPKMVAEPFLYYNRQGPGFEWVGGSWLVFSEKDNPNNFILAPGFFYRVQDAIIPALRLQYQNWTGAISYDVTHTSVTDASDKKKLIGVGGFGALEFTLIYKGNFRKQTARKYAVPCRTF